MNKSKRDRDDIQRIADNILTSTLTEIFYVNGLKYIPNKSGEHEIGIDFYNQVFNRKKENEQVLSFQNQNKGTSSPIKVIKQKNHPNRDKIGFTLQLRHIRQYYYELSEAMIITLCDINLNEVYWYPIQLDDALPKRIKEKENELKKIKSRVKKPKLQIYIPSNNILNSENYKDFINDIHLSKEEQNSKHRLNRSFEADYSKIEKEIEGKHIIDKSYIALNYFEGINVLPNNVIVKLPFLKGSLYRTSINDFSLRTDNKEFFDFISKISIKNDQLIYNTGEKCVENQDIKLKTIIDFLKTNLINNIIWGGKNYKPSLFVYNLFTFKDCDCAKCNFDKLKIANAQNIVQSNLRNQKITFYEQLRNGYASYLLGLLSTSVQTFNFILSNADKSQNPILYILAKYNLIKLKKIIEKNYYKHDSLNLINNLNEKDLDNYEAFIKRTAPHFIDVFMWIKDEKFYNSISVYIDIILEESKNMNLFDKYGVAYSHRKKENLIATFLRFYSFLESNYIIYDYFYEFEKVCTKVLECAFALYNILNPLSSRYDNFGNTMIKLWLFHVPFEKAKNLLYRYDIDKLITKENTNIIFTLNTYLNNLQNSNDEIKYERPLSNFKEKMERIIANIFLILSIMEISKEDINLLINKALKFILSVKVKGRIDYIPFNGFSQLLKMKNDISKENLKTILDLLIENKKDGSWSFYLAIECYVENATSQEIKEFIFNYLEVESINKEIFLKSYNKFNNLGHALSLLDNKYKNQISNLINDKLESKFDAELYYIAIIYELIDFRENLFDKFIDTVPNQSNEDYVRNFFNINENIRLSQVIDIAFMHKLFFKNKKKKLVEKCTKENKPYYEWLMNLDDFDYSRFNSLWILKHQTNNYINRFKKSSKLKNEIKKSLKEKYIEGVAKFYLEHFA